MRSFKHPFMVTIVFFIMAVACAACSEESEDAGNQCGDRACDGGLFDSTMANQAGQNCDDGGCHHPDSGIDVGPPSDLECTPDLCGASLPIGPLLCDDGSQMPASVCAGEAPSDCGYRANTCPPPEECAPGQTYGFGDGCRECTCPEEGGEIECTQGVCEEFECMTSADCTPDRFCTFFRGSCGFDERERGTCKRRPLMCRGTDSGACGCDGTFKDTRCELAITGQDTHRNGGCATSEERTHFLCAEKQCNAETEYCSITFSDIDSQGPSVSCLALPEGCPQGDCSCFLSDETAPCLSPFGFTIKYKQPF